MRPSLSPSSENFQLYPTPSYTSVTPKISSSFRGTFGLGLGFNSPKNEGQKVITLSTRVSTDIQRNVQRSERAGIIVDRKAARMNSDSQTKPTQGSLSVSKTNNPSTENLSGSGRIVDNRGGSVPRKKDPPSYQAISSNRQLFPYQNVGSVNMQDSLRRELGYPPKNRNLEVETEMEVLRNPVELKTQSSKNAETNLYTLSNSPKKVMRTQFTLDRPSRLATSTTPTGGQSGTFGYGQLTQTEPAEERAPLSTMIVKNKSESATKPVGGTMFLSGVSVNREPSREKGRASERDKIMITGNRKIGFSSNGQLKYTNPSQGVIKANNFFTNTSGSSINSIVNKERLLNQAQRPEYNNIANNVTIPQRPGTSDRKVFGRTQTEFTGALRSVEVRQAFEHRKATSELRDSEPSDFKDRTQDDSPSIKKPALQSFVTKVNKGEFVLSLTKNASESDSQPNQNAIRGNGSDKTPSPARTPTKSKTFSFEKKESLKSNKTEDYNKLAPPNYSQEQPEQLAKPSRPTTPIVQKEMKEIFEGPTLKGPIYYVSSLEKYHKEFDPLNYFCQIYREHFMQSYQALMFCKYMKPADQKALAQKKVSLHKRDTHRDKRTLIFDMDETLIHCNESPTAPSDVVLPIRFPHGEVIEAGINIRPYALEILKEMSQYYEIIVFTASHSAYANVVLDYLDPHGLYIHHRLFREHCMPTEEGVYIKDLRVIGNRSLNDMILVDNASYSFGHQIDNGIPIIPFYDNKVDTELKTLMPYLRYLTTVKDVREINKLTFKLSLYSHYTSIDDVLENLVFQD